MVAKVQTLSDLLGKPDFFHPKQLERAAESSVSCHLRGRGGLGIPVMTDDLTTLVEAHAETLDLYADLSDYGLGVEGVTLFQKGRKPIVRIAGALSDHENENRLRSTLAHEFGHVLLHDPMYQRKAQASLFDDPMPVTQVSFRDEVQKKGGDLFEYQAWYICGAVLMPLSELSNLANQVASAFQLYSAIYLHSDLGSEILRLTSMEFRVSLDLARIRLLKSGLVTDKEPAPSLF